jgi:hypothetical protein
MFATRRTLQKAKALLATPSATKFDMMNAAAAADHEGSCCFSKTRSFRDRNHRRRHECVRGRTAAQGAARRRSSNATHISRLILHVHVCLFAKALAAENAARDVEMQRRQAA